MSVDQPTEATLAFLDRILTKPCRVLEVGCGEGRLAAGLQARGFRVVAVDQDAANVQRAQARGVDAHCASFPDGPHVEVDAVLFTRSLHHVDELDAALASARERLAPRGHLVVEDWAWEGVDSKTLTWAHSLFAALRAAGLPMAAEWQLDADRLQRWQDEHEHHIHSSARWREAVAAHFEVLGVEPAPYFFRYCSRDLADEPAGRAVVESVLASERQGIALGDLVPLGLNLWARPLPGV
ncbi:MAG: class I SAM-dependent methyltransferase [Planctomycetota bacterium]